MLKYSSDFRYTVHQRGTKRGGSQAWSYGSLHAGLHCREVQRTTSSVYSTLDGQARANQAQKEGGRLCLIKSCGRRFVPRPQDRWRAKFCSSECRRKARRWRNWRYRQSHRGKRNKQVENKCFRETHTVYFQTYRRAHLERIRAIERQSKHRSRSRAPDKVHKGSPMTRVPCHRPGCYIIFSTLSALREFHRYCGEACRRAMRRFSALLAQLRYRRTPSGNYKRKLGRDGSIPA